MTLRRSLGLPALVLSRAFRVALAAPLAVGIGTALTSSALNAPTAAAALTIAALTFWRSGIGILAVAGLAPAGRLFAPAPVAELFVWSFAAAWLLALWRPLFPAGWRSMALTPALLYLVALIVSWLGFTIAGAAGVPPGEFPSFLAHVIPADYLAWSSEQPEVRVMLHSAAGVVMFVAALAAARSDRGMVRATAIALVATTALLAIATTADVVRQWATQGGSMQFALRFFRGERFSLHLTDVNAAGSLYAMAALIAVALAAREQAARRWWLAAVVMMGPAAFLAGSRAAFVAFGAGLLLIAAALTGWRPTRAQKILAAGAVAGIVLTSLVAADWSTEVRNTAGRAMSLRSQFTAASVQMFRTAPLFGVGIGKYFDRSGEFFGDELRRLYGNENAHNYFFQQFAELGVVGGVLFLAAIAVPLLLAWCLLRRGPGNGPLLGLFAGAVAYLLTCITGHPLLVPEATMPFWIALGVIAGAASPPGAAPAAHAGRWHATAIGTVGLLLAGSIALGCQAYRTVTEPPAGYGFHETQTADDGTTFRWMTRHAVTYVEDGTGFLRLRVKAPAPPRAALPPFVLETAIAGRVVDRRSLPFDQWVTYEIPVRRPASLPFRRVDLRLNQIAWEPVVLGVRTTERPIGVMISELELLMLP